MAKKTATETIDNPDYIAESDMGAMMKSEFDALDFSFDDLEELGLERILVDVEGYWDPETSPIFGELLGVAKAIETEYGVTGIYAIRLIKPCAARKGSKQDSDTVVLKPGQLCGVFHSTGLNPLKNMGGAKVAIRRLPEQLTLGKGRSMWQYDIRADKTRNKVNIIDNRSPENSGAPF